MYRRRKKKAKNVRRVTFILIVGIFGVFFNLSGCEQFGALPSGDSYLRIQQSENYNLAEDKSISLKNRI